MGFNKIFHSLPVRVNLGRRIGMGKTCIGVRHCISVGRNIAYGKSVCCDEREQPIDAGVDKERR